MNRSTIRRTAVRTAAVAAVAAGGLALASPAFAAGGPSDTAQATLTVNQTMSFAFTSATSFALSPGVQTSNALSFTVTTNDNHGYSVSLAAPDLSNGAATIPAADLTYSTWQGGAMVGGQAYQLSNAAQTFITVPAGAPAANGDSYSENWVANIPGNTPPGAYVTTLTFVAVGQ